MAPTTTKRLSSRPIPRFAHESRIQPERGLPPALPNPGSPRATWVILTLALAMLSASLFAKGHGYRKAFQHFLAEVLSGQIFSSRPVVEAINIADGQTHVPVDIEFFAKIRLPNGSLDEYSVNITTVTLTCIDDHSPVDGMVNLVHGGERSAFRHLPRWLREGITL